MSSKHTPGPWFAYSLLARGIHSGYQYGIANSKPEGTRTDEDGCVYPDFPNWNKDSRIIAKTTDSETARDDARLIASAPDLLTACKALVAHYRTVNMQGVPEVWPLWDAARSAIARAEGGGK